jgi:two-component system, NtrC family, response regulator PilR
VSNASATVNTPASGASHARILVIDDEPDLRTLYELSLLRQGYEVVTAGYVHEALKALADHAFDAVISDMRLPDGTGLEVLAFLAQHQRAERCVVMTAYGSAENAVESLKAGAFDYLTKPVDLKQFRTVVASAIAETAGLSGPKTGTRQTATVIDSRDPSEGADNASLQRLVGTSAAMHSVKARIARVARSMAPILVHGESGTGKELVAQAVHGCSHRASGPFIAVNCGAIPENLLEAEFFGAKKGSYTGATQDRLGYFQAARNGTLFLDEIGDLPLAMQSKLLRAIQERSVRSLGTTHEEVVDVRIVSATHKDLGAEVKAGRFRQDLYYRLNVIEIAVPPLRERRSDLPALCAALLTKISTDSNLAVPELSPQLLRQLDALPLPGNVRELENLLHRALALNDGQALDLDGLEHQVVNVLSPVPSALPVGGSVAAPGTRLDALSKNFGEAVPDGLSGNYAEPIPDDLPDDLQAYLDAIEKSILIRALQGAKFNRTAAAARLKLSLRQMRYRIARLDIALPHDVASLAGDDDELNPQHDAR